jgi:predicted nuclease of predicted toxin-antitoxin system
MNAADWQVVALALAPDPDILTEDKDFFECGVAPSMMETLIAQLERRGW